MKIHLEKIIKVNGMDVSTALCSRGFHHKGHTVDEETFRKLSKEKQCYNCYKRLARRK